MALAFYRKLDNNILLSSWPLTCILLYTDFALIVFFPNLLFNLYLVFPVKLAIVAKKTKLNIKLMEITPGFVYTKYKVQRATFKSATLNLQCKLIKRSTQSHKQFCSIYVQLSRLQNLEKILFLEPISLDDINNQSHYKSQTKDNQFQNLENITSLLFANKVLQKRRQMRDY